MSDDTGEIRRQSVPDYEEDEISFLELLETLWSGRKLIIGVTFLFTAAALVTSLLLSNKYKAEVTILPDTDQGGRGHLAQFAGIASMVGVDIGGTSDAQLYPSIIRSESVLRNVIHARYLTSKIDIPVNLMEYWEIEKDTVEEEYEETLKRLREEVINVSVDRETKFITLTVETNDPKLSADIANNIADQLDEYMLTKRRTRATEQRDWIERRLKEVEEELELSEENLKDFRERNRRIADSPELMLEQQRLVREVEMNNALFIELKKQNETIKVQEIRDMPIVQVLDHARVPVEKSSPRRKMIVIAAFIMGGCLSVGMVFMRNFINSSEENQSFFRRISSDVRSDLGLKRK